MPSTHFFSFIGAGSPPPTGDWILLTGFWDDTGVWDDAEVWND